jgi:hypothetical protein
MNQLKYFLKNRTVGRSPQYKLNKRKGWKDPKSQVQAQEDTYKKGGKEKAQENYKVLSNHWKITGLDSSTTLWACRRIWSLNFTVQSWGEAAWPSKTNLFRWFPISHVAIIKISIKKGRLRLFLVLAILSWRSEVALQVMPSSCQQEEAKVRWKKDGECPHLLGQHRAGSDHWVPLSNSCMWAWFLCFTDQQEGAKQRTSAEVCI